MTTALRLRGAALLVGLLAPLPAMAQSPATPSEAGAGAIAQAVRDWLAQMTANALDLSALALKVVADGDTYRLEVPFGGSYFDGDVVLGEAAMAATVRPLDGGRWEIVNAAMPPRLRAEMRSRKDGTTATMSIALESQETTGTLDPSLAGPSRFSTTVSGYTTTVEGPTGLQTSRIGKLTGRTEWTPAGPGRVTVQGDSTMQDYASVSPLPGGQQAKVTIGRINGASRIENFDMAGFGALMRTAFELGASARDGKTPDKAAGTALAKTLLAQVAGMLDAMESEYAYDDIRVEGGTMFSGSLRHFGMGLSVGAPDGKADVKLRLALEGLDTPLIPPGPWLEFIPHKLTLTPRVGGVPKEAVMGLLRRAIETEGKNMAGDAMVLLTAHPVSLGIDDLLIDLGPMRLKGEGSVEVSSLDEANGEAELRATGFDALIRRANAVPELKMAAPVLIFLKGIAVQEGSETVWRITYADRKVVVNDTDLSDLLPSR
jgi:hypothetical protein